MKRVLTALIALALIAALAAGAFLLIKLRSPEYVLNRAINDVKKSGLEGLRPYLTDDAAAALDAVETIQDTASGSGALQSLVETRAVKFLKAQIGEIDWTLEDVLRGRKQSEVVVGFDYQGRLTGTINLTLRRAGQSWKIDGLSLPHIEKASLW